MLNKYGIKATWFVPAHSVESFPGQLNKVRDGGHEMFVGYPMGVCTCVSANLFTVVSMVIAMSLLLR